jgi:hypothetical protein
MMHTATDNKVALIDAYAVAFSCWEVGRCGLRTPPMGEMVGAACALSLIQLWQR